MPSSTSFPGSCTEPALAIAHLTGPAGASVVRDISLRVPCREIVVVLGAIQSGKSMILRHVVGLERAERGSMTIGGESYDLTAPPGEPLRRMRQRVGVVFESSALLRQITVVENVELPLLENTGTSRAEAREAARELLRQAGIQADDDMMPVDLGRADQRRVALARALALGPCALVLDEPTVGLDAHAAHEFDETLDALQARHGFGVLILTREVRHAFGKARAIHVLVDGRIVAHGPREALVASDDPIVRRLLNRRGRE
jgi:phospholipid/cholesterol/gamma-HCH transport system ATP-binding protein